jgi:ABC-type bacteriocin/lantibiotic exporter with double-glycine peptidase domain
VVKKVSFEIEPGQSVAIVGRSGSGKTTLARILLGLHPPTSGRVLYDGVDLTELDVRTVRRQIGIVPQRAYLFGVSVRENIALNDPGLSLERVRKASKLACIDRELAALPLGYDTILADGGASMSGGQRQRIALARALVAEPSILVLDEATSELDSVTEAEVFENLRKLKATRVIIAHRLSTIAKADVIIVMDEGEVVEIGRHAELLKKRGKYGELVAAQAASRPGA